MHAIILIDKGYIVYCETFTNTFYALRVTPHMCFEHLRVSTILPSELVPVRELDEGNYMHIVCPHPEKLTMTEALKVLHAEMENALPLTAELMKKLGIKELPEEYES